MHLKDATLLDHKHAPSQMCDATSIKTDKRKLNILLSFQISGYINGNIK